MAESEQLRRGRSIFLIDVLFKPIVSVLLPGVFTLILVIPTRAEITLSWELKGTGLDKNHAYAILQNKQTGKQQWVRVGEIIDEARVVRIERARVVLFDQSRKIDLLLAGLDSDHIPPLFSPPKDMGEQGKDINTFLSDEINRLMDKPVPMTENDRKKLVAELMKVQGEGKMVPASSTLVIGGGEEWLTGAKTTTDIKSMGLQKGDLIFLINGMSPDPDKRKWENIFDVLKRAKLIIFSYLHGEKLYSKVFEIQ